MPNLNENGDLELLPENEAIAKMRAEALKILAELKKLGELSDEKYKESVSWFNAAKKPNLIEAQLKKIQAKLPPDQQPVKSLADEIEAMLLQLAGNDRVRAAKILKDAIIFWNGKPEVESKLDVISSKSQIKDAMAQDIVKAIEFYQKEVIEKKNGNGNGAPKAEAKPAVEQKVQQPAATIQKEVEAAI